MAGDFPGVVDFSRTLYRGTLIGIDELPFRYKPSGSGSAGRLAFALPGMCDIRSMVVLITEGCGRL